MTRERSYTGKNEDQYPHVHIPKCANNITWCGLQNLQLWSWDVSGFTLVKRISKCLSGTDTQKYTRMNSSRLCQLYRTAGHPSVLSRLILHQKLQTRTEWDSNPRYARTYVSFQDWYHKPLGHPSRHLSNTIILKSQFVCSVDVF